MRDRVRLVLALALLTTIRPATVWAWGCEGHRTVALIAERHLNDHARARATALLKQQPIDPDLPRFCHPKSASRFADASTWADDVRERRPQTAGWHFLDVPRGAPEGNASQFCPQKGCVTSAIKKNLAVLSSNASAQQRADALRFVIHLVGDLHQPLHCATNNDRGGNCVPVTFFGTRPTPNEAKTKFAPNLHGVWDTSLIQRAMPSPSLAAYAAALDQRFAPRVHDWEQAGIALDDWAAESHRLAEDVTYGRLPVAIAVETPAKVSSCRDANDVGERMLQLDERLAQPYGDAATPVVEEQLAKAGVRLAMVLNALWP